MRNKAFTSKILSKFVFWKEEIHHIACGWLSTSVINMSTFLHIWLISLWCIITTPSVHSTLPCIPDLRNKSNFILWVYIECKPYRWKNLSAYRTLIMFLICDLASQNSTVKKKWLGGSISLDVRMTWSEIRNFLFLVLFTEDSWTFYENPVLRGFFCEITGR